MHDQLRWIFIGKSKRGKQRYQLDVCHAMSVAIGSLPEGDDFTIRELACYLEECIARARAKGQVPQGVLLYPPPGIWMQASVERELGQETWLRDLIERTEDAQVYRRRMLPAMDEGRGKKREITNAAWDVQGSRWSERNVRAYRA